MLNQKKFSPQKKLLVVGKFSSLKNMGVSNNFDILVKNLRDREILFDQVRIPARSKPEIGNFQFVHGARIMGSIIYAWWKMIPCKNIYLQVAFSLMGFLRDALIIWPAAIMKKKIFLRVHGGGYGDFYQRQSGLIQSFIKNTLRQANMIIVLGEALREQFSFSPDLIAKTVVVHNGLDVPGKKDNYKKAWDQDNGLFNILYLSNLIQSKGYLHVLEALKLLKQESKLNFHCDFYGEFLSIEGEEDHITALEMKKMFFAQIEDWDLNEYAEYHGVATGLDKYKAFEHAHVFVLPTEYIWEGQPLSIIEAMAYGLPVITTAYRAIPEQILDGYNGLLVEFAHPREIKEAFIKLHEDPNYYDQLSKNAIKSYMEKFTEKQHMDKLIPLITK